MNELCMAQKTANYTCRPSSILKHLKPLQYTDTGQHLLAHEVEGGWTHITADQVTTLPTGITRVMVVASAWPSEVGVGSQALLGARPRPSTLLLVEISATRRGSQGKDLLKASCIVLNFHAHSKDGNNV